MLSCIENETIQHMRNYRLHHEYKLQAHFDGSIDYPILLSNTPMHQSQTSLWMIGAQSQIQILIPSALLSTESGL